MLTIDGEQIYKTIFGWVAPTYTALSGYCTIDDDAFIEQYQTLTQTPQENDSVMDNRIDINYTSKTL